MSLFDGRPLFPYEEKGPGGATILTQHISHSLCLLRQQLLTHQFREASVTMETFSLGCVRELTPVVRKFGLEVLLRDNDGETYGQCLQFYKLISSRLYKFREELLIEMVLYIASRGTVQEAYDTLQSQAYLPPFNVNPLIQGYCGVLQYVLWRKERAVEKEEEGEKPSSSPSADSVSAGVRTASRAVRHEELALQHFQSVRNGKMDGTLVVNDPFICCHTELLVARGDEQEALDLLLENRQQYPHMINPNRYVCDHLRTHRHDDTELRIHHLQLLVKLDESCSEAIGLSTLLLQQGSVHHASVLSLLTHYLDYPCNSGDSIAWQLLKQLQSDWPDYCLCEEWRQRLPWWKKLYPEQLKMLMENKE